MTNKSELVSIARQAVSLLPPLEPPFQEFTWKNRRRAIREHILTENFDEFLQWSTIQATMVVGNNPYIESEYRALPKDRYTKALVDPGIGKPPVMEIGKMTTNPSLVHQVFHLYQWEKITGKQVEWLHTITEFGGGYGAMAYACRRLGFSKQYVIHDLPEISLLQRYYLTLAGYDADYFWTDDESSFMPPYYGESDLLIACFSLSEVGQNFRHRFFDAINPGSCLFAIQETWDGKNVLFEFNQLTKANPEYEWAVYPHPYFRSHWYCIGDKKN
jgi:hypothetical protein